MSKKINILFIALVLVINAAYITHINHFLNTLNKDEKVVYLTAEFEPCSVKEQSNQDKQYDIPDYDTSFKTYMDYRAITNTASQQYKMQKKAWTDENGLRRFGDDYIVAVGTYYSTEIGKRITVTLDNGAIFTAIVGDIKQDKHTDKNNQYSPVYDSDGNFISANVIEFIVDTKQLPQKAKVWGSIGALDEFQGNITNITDTERI